MYQQSHVSSNFIGNSKDIQTICVHQGKNKFSYIMKFKHLSRMNLKVELFSPQTCVHGTRKEWRLFPETMQFQLYE